MDGVYGTSISRIHVRYQRWTVRVQVGDHLRVGPHVVKLGET